MFQGYKVYYTLSPEQPVELWTVHPVEGGLELTTITNLLTNRTYTIRILAFTSVGDGPLSDILHVKMQPGGLSICSSHIKMFWHILPVTGWKKKL